MRCATVFELSFLAVSISACGGNQPELVSVSIGEPTAPLLPTGALTVTVSARYAFGEPIVVTSQLVPELSGRPRPLDQQSVEIRSSAELGTTELAWRPTSAAFAHEGSSELYFTAALADQVVESERRSIVVEPKVLGLSLSYGSPVGRRVPDTTNPVPPDAEIELRVSTQYLVGRRDVHFQIFLDDDLTPIQSFELTPSEDEETISHKLEATWLGTASQRRVRIRAETPGSSAEQELAMASQGVHRCGFYSMSGSPIGASERVSVGSMVELRLYAWGVPGEATTFAIAESDTFDDDPGPVLDGGLVTDGLARAWWATIFVDDGVGDGVDEWFFQATAGPLSCFSANMEVPR